MVVVVALGVEGRDEGNRMGSAQVGRQADGSVVVTTNQVLTPAGRQVEFRGRPLSVVLSPDGRTAAFLNGTNQAIILVDVPTWTVNQEFSTAGGSASFTGIAYSADGRQLCASQASGRVIVADVTAAGTRPEPVHHVAPQFPLTPDARMAIRCRAASLSAKTRARSRVVLSPQHNSIAAVDLASSRVTREIPVGNAPHGILVAGNLAPSPTRADAGPGIGLHETTPAARPSWRAADPARHHRHRLRRRSAAGSRIKSIGVGLHPTAMALDDRRL
jgi:hypothetical protein